MIRHKSSLVDSDALRSASDLESPLAPSSEDPSVPASRIGMGFVDALFRPRCLPKVEWVVIERVLVNVIDLDRGRITSRHGVDDTVGGVGLAIDVDHVKGVGSPLVGNPPPCHSSFWTTASVYCVAKPRETRGINVE